MNPTAELPSTISPRVPSFPHICLQKLTQDSIQQGTQFLAVLTVAKANPYSDLAQFISSLRNASDDETADSESPIMDYVCGAGGIIYRFEITDFSPKKFSKT